MVTSTLYVDDILQVTTCPRMREELHAILLKTYGQIVYHPKSDAYVGLSILKPTYASLVSVYFTTVDISTEVKTVKPLICLKEPLSKRSSKNT
jgi:hypothetical protein